MKSRAPAKRNRVGSGKRWISSIQNGISKRLARLDTRAGSRGPRMSLLELEVLKLTMPVRATIAPKVEGEGVELTRKRLEASNVEANPPRANKELESTVGQERHSKVRCRAAEGHLKDGAHGGFIKAKFIAPKSNNQGKGRGDKLRESHR